MARGLDGNTESSNGIGQKSANIGGLSGDLRLLLEGFSKLSVSERYARLVEAGVADRNDIEYLRSGGLQSIELAEHFIENAIGYMQVPLGVASNFRIDGRDYIIPMAVEETSIIAAASKTAKWVRDAGTLITGIDGDCIIGQVQLAKVRDSKLFAEQIEKEKLALIELANREVAHGLVARGGGVRDLALRFLDRPDGGKMAVVHIYLDPVDAMGANIMNQVCEFLKGPIEKITGEKVTMCILSNLVDSRLTWAEVQLPGIDLDLGERIAEASLFAELDPYRAATNNKGVLNGMDPILVATGNDWRALESGVHAYAARSGQYRSITEWKMVKNNGSATLVGKIKAPLIVGTVGGVTKLHPTAKMALRMLQVESAGQLSRVLAAVGLVQNLGALRALTTVGIIEGHMKLHIRNLALGAGALEKETPLLQRRLEEILLLRKRISLQNAIDVLKEIRSGNNVVSTPTT